MALLYGGPSPGSGGGGARIGTISPCTLCAWTGSPHTSVNKASKASSSRMYVVLLDAKREVKRSERIISPPR
jgi:hypothetical protein